MKKTLVAMPLLAAGILSAGCATSSPSPATSPTPPATSPAAAATTPAASPAPSPGTGSPGTGSPGAAAVSARAPACESADLRASLGGGAGVGMSQNHTGLQLRNAGPSACALYGYPGVSWVAGADGRQVGAAAGRAADNSGGAEKAVILAPRALASAPLDIVDAAAFPRSRCRPVPVRGLRVYPPGERAALFIPLPTAAGGYGECSGTAEHTLIIGYMQPGAQPGGGGRG